MRGKIEPISNFNNYDSTKEEQDFLSRVKELGYQVVSYRYSCSKTDFNLVNNGMPITWSIYHNKRIDIDKSIAMLEQYSILMGKNK